MVTEPIDGHGSTKVRNFHVPDYLILLFGLKPVGEPDAGDRRVRFVKSDLQKIMLSAVSADGLYFSTDGPVIFIGKSDKRPLCIANFTSYFGSFPDGCWDDFRINDQAMLNHMCTTLKSHNPNMRRYEEMFLDLYFETLKTLAAYAHPKFADQNDGARAFKLSMRLLA